jgi:UDP-glucuronate 4-epimerase
LAWQDLLARTQVFLALKKRGDGGVVGIDNFNSYYEISLK